MSELPKPQKRGPKPKRYLRKQRKTSLSAAKRKLWPLFAAYIKNRDGPTCFSCGATGLKGRSWHAGHLVSRRIGATLYAENNVFSQCGHCNVFLRGNWHAFAQQYVERFGEAALMTLLDQARQIKRWTVPELEALIDHYERA